MKNIFGKVFDLLSGKERFHLSFLFASMVVLAGIEMAGIASILPFIAMVANPDIVLANRWLKLVYEILEFTSEQNFLFFLGLIVLVLLVLSNVLKGLTTWLMQRYNNQLYYMLGRRLLSNYLANPYVFFLNRNTAEMGKNILDEVRNVVAGVIGPGMQGLSNFLLSFFILVLLVCVHPFIAVSITIVLGGTYALIYSMVRFKLMRIGEGQIFANAMKYKAVGEALSGIKDLKILGREEVFLERFAIHAQSHARYNTSVGVISQIPRYALEIVAFGGILIIMLYFLNSGQDFTQVVPFFALYAFAGYKLLPALQQIFASISTIRYYLPSVDIIHRDMAPKTRELDFESLNSTADTIHHLPFKNKLEINKVTFFYPGAQQPTLKDISLSITPNTTISLVGATGSGKTTLVDLILGLLEPTHGQLLADGVEVDSNNLLRWQLNLGYVPQLIYLCDDTITRNIAFGVRDDEIDMQAVLHAARIANLTEYIENELPEGFETIVGDRGIRLSGGQRQRIGIARALYRDPAVLILDEATSALDGVTEDAVMEAIQSLSRKKTIIMIAHRLSTVQSCDMIYLMDRGCIVDQGKYSELRKTSKWFHAAGGGG